MESYCASSSCNRGDGGAKRIEGEARYKRHWCSVECWQDSDKRCRKPKPGRESSEAYSARLRKAIDAGECDVTVHRGQVTKVTEAAVVEREDTEPRGQSIRGEPE